MFPGIGTRRERDARSCSARAIGVLVGHRLQPAHPRRRDRRPRPGHPADRRLRGDEHRRPGLVARGRRQRTDADRARLAGAGRHHRLGARHRGAAGGVRRLAAGRCWPRRDAAATGGTDRQRFIEGFVTSSLVFCVGPLTVLGSLNDGLGNGADQLFLKSALDGFAAIAFAASLGWGVGGERARAAGRAGLPDRAGRRARRRACPRPRSPR